MRASSLRRRIRSAAVSAALANDRPEIAFPDGKHAALDDAVARLQRVKDAGINTIVTFGALLITLVVGFIVTSPDIATVPLLVVALAVAGLLPVIFYPWSKTIWTAIDLAISPLEPGEASRLAGTAQLPG